MRAFFVCTFAPANAGIYIELESSLNY
jgi:hypothetical protein